MSYEQIIYNQFRKRGTTEAGALGCVGNFWCESNCEPFRLQGDFSPYKTASKAYVNGVTSGAISRQAFGSDQKGFGIYQLTLNSRKLGYYDYWKASGKPLDSAELQVDYAVLEMKRDFPNLWRFLTQTTDVFTAVSRVCREFERPYINNIDARFQSANRIKNEIDLNAWDKDEPTPEPTPAPAPQPSENHKLELRTIDKNCSSFTEVYLAKSLLINRGYDSANGGLLAVDDIWTDALTEAVVQFQKDFGLDADGVIGPASWAELLKI